MTVRNSSNAIRSLTDANGVTTTNPETMSKLAVDHFQSIIGVTGLTSSISSSWIQNLTDFRCNNSQQRFMASPPLPDEILKVVLKLNPNKAPGPDGLTSGFFKASWNLLGNEFITSVLKFFSTGFLPQIVNSTILTLVPKRPGASSITDFRPIACCNTVYKVISKLMVVRIKQILPSLILANQTAFIKGRLLMENTLLASELVSGYHSNKGPPRITLKVDLAKAFDMVSWDFIITILRGIQVPETYLRWLYACVCTPSYSVGFNGSLHGYFKGKRGLRQGDPLSPYLFVIAMNCLSLLLNKAATEGKFGYHMCCRELKITHLCFADDLLIFTDGSLNSVRNILSILSDFHLVSGLGLNIHKTSFFSAGLSTAEIQEIISETGLTLAHLPTTYLGLPLNSKKLSLHTAAPLI